MSVHAVRVLQAAAILMIGLALYLPLGWAAGTESMVQVWPSSAAIPLNTAVLFLASDICLNDKMKVQVLLDITERLQFSAAEKAAQSLLEGLQ